MVPNDLSAFPSPPNVQSDQRQSAAKHVDMDSRDMASAVSYCNSRKGYSMASRRTNYRATLVTDSVTNHSKQHKVKSLYKCLVVGLSNGRFL